MSSKHAYVPGMVHLTLRSLGIWAVFSTSAVAQSDICIDRPPHPVVPIGYVCPTQPDGQPTQSSCWYSNTEHGGGQEWTPQTGFAINVNLWQGPGPSDFAPRHADPILGSLPLVPADAQHATTRRVILEEGSTPEFDVFIPRGLVGTFIATERFKETCEAAGLTNVVFIPADSEEAGYNLYPSRNVPRMRELMSRSLDAKLEKRRRDGTIMRYYVPTNELVLRSPNGSLHMWRPFEGREYFDSL